jgi:hypothetical protein
VDPIFDDAAALDTAVDMLDPQPARRYRRETNGVQAPWPYLSVRGPRPTVSPSHNAARLLSYQSLPTSSGCGEAMTRRRKLDK